MEDDKGFTLIEIAIVLMIAGILIGLGAGMMGVMKKRAQNIETKELVNGAVQSLVTYGAANNKLPAAADFTTSVKNPYDAWQKSLYYITDSNLTSSSYGGICGRKTTQLTIKICPDAGCSSPTSTINNVALIVLSGGENYNNQTAGTQAVSSATTINVYEEGVSIDGYTTDINRTEAYDDIVSWVTIDELRVKAGCTGSQLKILTSKLYYGYVNSAYSGEIAAEGGVPYSSSGKYRWCIQENTSASGITFTPSTDDSACLSLDETSWGQDDSIVISGTPTAAGTYLYTVFVRDNNDASGANDNIAQKTLVLTINAVAPEEAEVLTLCTDYRVWNNYGSGRDYYRDSDCDYFSNSSEITTEGRYLNTGETIYRYSSTSDSCSSQQASLTFAQAEAADDDGDCCVNFTGTDTTCPTECTEYRVWNNYGSSRYFIREGDCDYIANGSEVTSESKFLSSGENLRRYNDKDCDENWEATITYAQAAGSDTDGDCCLNFSLSDKTCP